MVDSDALNNALQILRQKGFVDEERNRIVLKYSLNNVQRCAQILKVVRFFKVFLIQFPKLLQDPLACSVVTKENIKTFTENDYREHLAFIYSNLAVDGDLNRRIFHVGRLELIENALAESKPDFTDALVADFEELKIALSSIQDRELPSKDDYLFYTVRLEISYGKGKPENATAFWFQSNQGKIYLILNKHAIFDDEEDVWAKEIQFLVHRESPNKKPTARPVQMKIRNPKDQAVFHHDDSVDLVAIPFDKIENPKKCSIYIRCVAASSVVGRKVLEMFSAVEEVYMYGYPNGLWDEQNNLPLIRKGVTASHPALYSPPKGEHDPKSGFVDMACWPGSSGSPIFLVKQKPTIFGETYLAETITIFLGVQYGGPSIRNDNLPLSTKSQPPSKEDNSNSDSESLDFKVDSDQADEEFATLSKKSGKKGRSMIHLGYYCKAERVVELTEIAEANTTPAKEDKESS